MGRVTGSALIKLAVIAVLSSSHVWRICSAQSLPVELQTEGLFPLMRQHFCPMNESYDDYERQTICWNIKHNNNVMQSKCSNSTGRTCMEEDQSLHCSYQDATVCRYDRRGSCIYSDSSSILPFCVCRNEDGLFPTSFSDGDSIQSSCSDPTEKPATTAIGTTSQLCERNQVTTIKSSCSDGYPTEKPATTAIGTTAQLCERNQVTTIVLGTALCLVTAVLVIVLCRSGKLKSWVSKKNSQKQDDHAPNMELGTQVFDRESLAEPPGDVDEYAYAYNHVSGRPALPGTSATHAYVNAQESALCRTAKPALGSPPRVELHRSPDETTVYDEVSDTNTDGQDNAASSSYQQLNRATMKSATYQELRGMKADDRG